MADYIINLSGNICEVLIMHFFFSTFERKYSKKATVALSVLFTAFQFLNTNLFLTSSSLVMLGSALFSLLVSLLYETKWRNRLLYSVLLYCLMALPEVIIAMAMLVLFEVDVSFIQNNPFLFATATLTSKFLSYVFVLFTKKRRLKFNSLLPMRSFFWIFILPGASIFLLLLVLRCFFIIEDSVMQITLIISSGVLMFANIAVFYIIDRLNELIETKEKLGFAELHIQNQLLHYRELNKHQNELRMFRHDIKTRLLALMAMVRDGQADKALKIMENNLNWLDEMNSGIINSGNPIVDAILQSKLHTAKEKQIDLQISTKLADKIEIDELELGIVLGNALDNAIEAAERNTDSKLKRISLTLMSADGRISISVSNPVETEINTERLTTVKHDKDKHGYGIKSIKAIADKYEGIVRFTCENGIFEANINLQNKKD